MSPWNCFAVLNGQLYTHSRSHWPSTSVVCHSAEVGRTVLSIEQFQSSALFCCVPVNLEFAARQSSWLRTESRHLQMSADDIHFCEILMTKCIEHIRDLFEYALYKFTLYLLTYFLTHLISLNLHTLKYRRLHGDMIEVFKILNDIHDGKVTPTLHYNNTSVTRGNTFKLCNQTFTHNFRKYFSWARIVNIWNGLT